MPSKARAIDAGPRVRMIYAACEDGFYLSTTGGHTWGRLPVPKDGGRPVDVMIAPDGSYTLYATTTKGAYRSPDFGEEFVGQTWEALTKNLPQAKRGRYHVATAAPGRIYAILENIVFTRRLDETGWTRGGMVGLPQYVSPYPWLVLDPDNRDRAITGMSGEIPGFGVKSLFQVTRDAGKTWSNDLESLYEKFHTAGFPQVLSLLLGGEICQPVIDPQNPTVVYAGKRGGLLRSTNAGETWETIGTGLDIPWVRSVFAPANSTWLFAGTPAGLFLSKDAGMHWETAHLVRQFEKNTRRQLGGAADIDAYWRARYYGFIDDTSAAAPFEDWGL